ncbi:MAG: hypothetical protein ACQEQI_01465 [Bacillota bacterium]
MTEDTSQEQSRESEEQDVGSEVTELKERVADESPEEAVVEDSAAMQSTSNNRLGSMLDSNGIIELILVVFILKFLFDDGSLLG